ncbi:TIGR02594 family protein [Shinella sp.]|uniref:NlpC/P60 family protein n=1 Tax=Shinella sp. TaxID=1870904 RepID=UPI00299FC742|nr:TIGR02594 family protein [Shinella sp.]MDX3977167.1 TIGR02594 family protein [Shinella sp.]
MNFDEWLIARLRVHGAYGGAMDGVPGRELHRALERFQASEHLDLTGYADQPTVNALRKAPSAKASALTIYEKAPELPVEPVWMREARRLIGVREVVGKGSNAVIMGWAKRLGGWVASFFKDDDIAWCGLFMAHVLGLTLPREPLPANPLGALQYNKFGRQLAVPALGAIMTFTRDGGGHVGLYVGEDKTHFHILGGNQGNSVRISRIEKDRLSDTRWPKTGEPERPGRVLLTAAGVPASSNER